MILKDVIYQASQNWRTFVRQQLHKGGGSLFKHISKQDKAYLSVDLSKFAKNTCSPSEAIAEQTKFWNQYWAPPNETLVQDVALEMKKLRDMGFDYITNYEYTAENFLEGLKGYSRESKGVDMWKSNEFKALPIDCIKLHASAVQVSIQKLAWPFQIVVSLQALLGKVNGVRTITLTSLLYSIWNRSQKQVRLWELEFVGEYDTCKPGSSALIAALGRAARAEICFWIGKQVATILHDFAKFFDTINIPILIKEAKATGYPIVSLIMAMQQHLAPRIIKYYDFVGKPVCVYNSIIAGCGQSVPLTRAYLGRGLKQIHLDHLKNKTIDEENTKVNTESYVDDCAQSTNHERVSVLTDSIMKAFGDFHKLSVKKLQLTLSDKGVVVTTDEKITKAICDEIKVNYKVNYNPLNATRDLGLSFTAGLVRPSQLLTQRLGANKSRISKTIRISKIHRAGRKLFSGSCFAASTWGHQSCGFSITALESLERQAAKCTGIKPEGRCRFTCLVLGYGWKSHPKARILRETFTYHFKLLASLRVSGEFQDAIYAWNKAKLVFENSSNTQAINTSCIHGPITVVIAYLRYLGWDPFGLNVWIDHNKDKWILDDTSRSPEAVISAFLERSNFWDQQTAALYYCGNGIDLGIDHEISFAWHRAKGISYIDRCTIETILCGGCWPNLRIHQIHPNVSPLCQRCGQAEDTALHCYWTCPCNSNIDDEAVAKTQDLIPSAVAKFGIETCFWLRGIVPIEWSQEALNRIEHNHTKDEACVVTNASGTAPNFSGSITVYGDASGGKFTSFQALRRVGVGLAAIDNEGELVWAISMNLPGKCQTVPRGELFAIYYTVFKSADDTQIEFITDNLGCYNTYNKGKILLSYPTMVICIERFLTCWNRKIFPLLLGGCLVTYFLMMLGLLGYPS